MHYIKRLNSPLGKLTLASDGECLIGLWIENQKYDGYHLIDPIEKNIELFDIVEKWLKKYFLGNNPEINFPIKMNGTPFQKLVWNELLKIPYGKTTTYKELAETIAKMTGKKQCCQAIGQAVGHNPISIIIPCHRVVGSDGSLTGYASGIEKKMELLKIEHIDFSNLYIPDKKSAL